MKRRALFAVIGILALQVLLASPAAAAGSCVPNPERVTAGFVAGIDEPRPEHGRPDHPYGMYAYAGTRWNTYSTDAVIFTCGDPFARTDTWLGNQFFNVGKTLVAAANSLWYLLLYGSSDGPIFGKIDLNLASGAKSLYDNAFTPLLSLVLLLAVVWILFKTLKGALAHITTKLLWILCAFWVAASSYLMPQAYTTFLDSILTHGVREIQGAVLTAAGYDRTHGMPQMLYDSVIWRTWLEGEFGSATTPIATEQGPRLLDAQAWTKFDSTSNTTDADLQRKKATFDDVAAKTTGTDAEGYFTGDKGARFGTGFIGMLRGFCYAYFPAMASLGQLLGMLILRLIILCAPILGLLMILYHRAAPAVLRAVGKVLASCVFLAIGSTAYLWILPNVLNGTSNPLLQMVLMLIITIVALVLIRPFRQITGMIGSIVQAAGLNHATNPMATSWAWRAWRRHRMWNKRERRLVHALGREHGDSPSTHAPPRRRPEAAPVAKPDPAPERRSRPEAWGPLQADSVRLPMPRPHDSAHRAGAIGSRVFFHGPRVHYQGPVTGTTPPPMPQQPHPVPSTPAHIDPAAVPATPGIAHPPNVPEPRSDRPGPVWDQHSPDPDRALVAEELVIPSERDEQRHDTNEPPQSRATTAPEPPVEIYHPSTDQFLTEPDDDTPPSAPRPETDDRGDADADPH